MRIVGGEWGGRRLTPVKSATTRPTSDGTRETLFNIMTHGLGHDVDVVLDLFAGTGALGFEALSRGARSVVYFESQRVAIETIKKNAEILKVPSSSYEIVSEEKTFRWRGLLNAQVKRCGPFDTIFCDPPYEKGLVLRALEQIPDEALTPNTLLVAEIAREEKLAAERVAQLGWQLIRERECGAAKLLFYSRAQ